MITKMKPSSVKNETVTAPHAALKRGLRKRDTSSIGARDRRSQATNPSRRAAAIRNPAMLRVLLQPASGASMIVNTSSEMAAVDRPKPPRSSAWASASREVGT